MARCASIAVSIVDPRLVGVSRQGGIDDFLLGRHVRFQALRNVSEEQDALFGVDGDFELVERLVELLMLEFQTVQAFHR